MANLKISQLTPGNPAQSGDVIPIERSDVNFSITAGSIAALAPAGVTSVGFEGDGTVLSSVESGPVTGSGILSATLNTQSANLVLAGPTSGSSAAPTFRAMVVADFPIDSPPQGMGFWSWYFANAPLTLIARTALSSVLSQGGAGGYQGWLMYIPRPMTVSHLCYEISTTVAGGTIDFGLYKQSGGALSLVASTGGVSTASGGTDVPTSVALTQGSVTIEPGWYYFVVTCSTVTTVATLTWSNFVGTFNDAATLMQQRATSSTSMSVFSTGSSGGVLPTTMPTWTIGNATGSAWDVPAVWFCS